MKKAHVFLLFFLFMSFIITPVSAHEGRTDSNGGHIDSGSGEYHYHHGYPAHAHFDMNGDGVIDCPYDFDDQTNYSSDSSSSGSSGSRPDSDPYTNGYKDGYEKGLLDGFEDGHSKGEEAGYKSGKEAAKADYEEQLTAVKWIAFSITVLIIILLLVIFRKILFNQTCSFEQEIRNLKSKYSMEIYQLQSAHDAEIRKLTAEKNSMNTDHATKIREINATSNAEIKRLQAKIRTQHYNDALHKIINGEDNSIPIPKDIRFKHSFTPIKGKVKPHYPFGDYTVFIADGRKKYHCSHKCAQNAKPLHFFDLPLDLDPCQRCVPKDMYPQPLPDWYHQIREKLDSQS